MSPNLEKMVSGLREQRELEQQNRALAFSGVGPTVCGVQLDHLTPLDRLRLGLINNAFLYVGLKPLKGDCYSLLVLMSSKMRTGGKLARYFERRRIARVVKRSDFAKMVREINEYLKASFQDRIEAVGDGEGKIIQDRPKHILPVASDAAFYMVKFGFTLEQYLATPCLVLQQLHRAYRQARDGDDNSFVNESDRMIGRALKKMQKGKS